MTEISEQCIGKWDGILRHYGLERILNKKHQPCIFCSGTDRFRYTDKFLKGNFICSQCHPDGGDGFGLLMEYEGKDFATIAKEIEAIVGSVKTTPPPKKTDPNIALDRVQRGCVSITTGDPVDLYLRLRGIKPNKYIRYHPSLAYYEDGRKAGTYPAMVARVNDAAGNRVTYHTTYLTADGKKAPIKTNRKVMPPDGTISGNGIFLGPVSNHMLIAEGIETTLAAMRDFKIPGIAAISSGGMEKIVLHSDVQEVLIIGDNDANFTGQAAAYKLANRLSIKGIYVEVEIPKEDGTDWADIK